MIDALPPTDLYRKLLKILKCSQFIARVYCKWTCSHPPAFGTIQAAQYSEQEPDGDLLDLHLFPSERFPLSGFVQEHCSYWMAEIQR